MRLLADLSRLAAHLPHRKAKGSVVELLAFLFFSPKQVDMTLNDVLPRVLPIGWTKNQSMFFNGHEIASFSHRSGLKVMVSVETYPDKSIWHHVSLSFQNKLPSWDDIRSVKTLFMGKDKLAIQILPREDIPGEYVNAHPNCFHIYRRLDGDTLPGLAPNDRTIT